jgi:hypothetical protein
MKMTNKIKILFIVIGFLLFVFNSYASANYFRCNENIIQTGDSKMEVIEKCGDPDDSEVVGTIEEGEIVNGKNGKNGKIRIIKQEVEKIYYNCGEGRKTKILTFEGGVLRKIENGDLGSGEKKCSF